MNYRNTNRGLIWSNDRKRKETQPDFKGSLNVRGEEFWISAWKQSENPYSGAQGLAFTVRPKNETTIEQPKDYVVHTEHRPGN